MPARRRRPRTRRATGVGGGRRARAGRRGRGRGRGRPRPECARPATRVRPRRAGRAASGSPPRAGRGRPGSRRASARPREVQAHPRHHCASAGDGARRPGRPLARGRAARPEPGPGEVLLEVTPAASAAPTCTSSTASSTGPKLPLVPGHQIVGRVAARRRALRAPATGWACPGSAGPTATAATAERAARTSATTPASPATTRRRLRRAGRRRRALLLPDPGGLPGPPGRAAAVRRADRLPRAAAWRATRERLGLYGFGAAAHIICQVALHEGRRVFAFTRARRRARRRRSRSSWAPSGPATRSARRPRSSTRRSSSRRSAQLVPAALRATAKGGDVVCAGIHMSDIPSLPVRDALGRAGAALGGEPHARATARSSCALAPRVPVRDRGRGVPARAGGRGARRHARRARLRGGRRRENPRPRRSNEALRLLGHVRPHPRPGGHPCGNAYVALKDAGHDPELIKSYGLGRCPRSSTDERPHAR